MSRKIERCFIKKCELLEKQLENQEMRRWEVCIEALLKKQSNAGII